MTESDLLWLSDENLAEFCREQARWLPNYQIDERSSHVLVASGTRFPGGSINCVLPRGDGEVDAPALIDAARGYFATLDRGFSVYAPTHRGAALGRACEAEGWLQLSDAPGMVLTSRVPDAAAPEGLELRVVRDRDAASAFVDVCAIAYESVQLPAGVTRKIFSMPERWLRPYVYAVVGYARGGPVSAAALLFSHGIAGVYWVASVPEARGYGYAQHVMRHVSNYAFDRGAGCVVLQATPFGEPIYRKLGYREITRYPFFLVTK